MINISKELAQKISFHGEKTYPEECCGAILGIDQDGVRMVKEVHEIHNAQDASRDRRFLVTPDQYQNAERAAKEKHFELLGFYHSHPNHPAEPSQFDLEHAMPWFSYVIVSVMGGRAGHMTAWVLNESRKRFDEQSLNIV